MLGVLYRYKEATLQDDGVCRVWGYLARQRGEKGVGLHSLVADITAYLHSRIYFKLTCCTMHCCHWAGMLLPYV